MLVLDQAMCSMCQCLQAHTVVGKMLQSNFFQAGGLFQFYPQLKNLPEYSG